MAAIQTMLGKMKEKCWKLLESIASLTFVASYHSSRHKVKLRYSINNIVSPTATSSTVFGVQLDLVWNIKSTAVILHPRGIP